MTSMSRALVVALTFLNFTALAAEPSAAPIFGEHMVLQRGIPVSIWGTADAGATVAVKFRTQTKTATADKDGKWRVALDPLEAGGPDTLQIGTKTLTDVLVGEVWFGSGQSNMSVSTGGAAKLDPGMAKIAESEYPTIRIALSKGVWRAATPKNNSGMSALALSFAVRLQEKLNVPIGVVTGSVGGSSTEFWLTPEHVSADAACQAAIAKYTAEIYPGLKAHHDEAVARWEKSENAKDPTKRPKAPTEPGKTTLEHHIVGKLFEEHVRPVVGMAMRGVLWDQGENVSAIVGPSQLEVLTALVRGWRKDWGLGEFPFVYIQKPSGGGCAWDPKDPLTQGSLAFAPLPSTPPNDGRQRETFINALTISNTAMAICSDLSTALHPPTKSSYGTRAARAALMQAYGEKIEIYGPLYSAHKIEGKTIRVQFSHVGSGLAVRHSETLQGFALAGEDKRFVWADAKIDGDNVIVSSDKIAQPAYVRYAWSQQHPWANLFSKEGLPAQAFRTDK